MTKRVEAVHRFDVPVDRGFAFITDTGNWSSFWPGFVRLEDGARWREPGDTARLVTRLLGTRARARHDAPGVRADRLVTYTSRQPGLPDAQHERHFEGR